MLKKKKGFHFPGRGELPEYCQTPVYSFYAGVVSNTPDIGNLRYLAIPDSVTNPLYGNEYTSALKYAFIDAAIDGNLYVICTYIRLYSACLTYFNLLCSSSRDTLLVFKSEPSLIINYYLRGVVRSSLTFT